MGVIGFFSITIVGGLYIGSYCTGSYLIIGVYYLGTMGNGYGFTTESLLTEGACFAFLAILRSSLSYSISILRASISYSCLVSISV
jgi:hypothetical protein